MPRWSNQQDADSSSRLGDLTLRKLHYQTGPARPVNTPKVLLIPLFNRHKTFNSDRRIAFQKCTISRDPAGDDG
jgi:hypothetical protein